MTPRQQCFERTKLRRPLPVSRVTPPTVFSNACLCFAKSDIMIAHKSFLPESTGDPDGLGPQHINDLTSASVGDAGHRLLGQLTDFANLCLVAVFQPPCSPSSIVRRCICAEKRRHSANCRRHHYVLTGSQISVQAVTMKMASSLLHVQIGFGDPRAVESVVHATVYI